MSDVAGLSCVLVGESNLLVHCAETLAGRGHRIAAVVTAETTMPRPAAVHRSLAEAMSTLAHPPDVLLSIVNRTILTPEEIGFARLAAINYHDSPLPAYAGVNAPSWAILRGETTHGVTWHRMARGIDDGEILVQRRFPLDADETALSLSMKCFEHALETFGELLDTLERGDVRGTPQDPARRTFFGRSRRLPRQGIIRWADTSAEICRFVRAGQFGPYANDFGLPKVLLPDGSLAAVAHAAILDPPTDEPPGTIVDVDRRSMRVVAGDGVVLNIQGLVRTDGRPFDVPPNVRGARLPLLTAAAEEGIESATVRAAETEDAVRVSLLDLPAPVRPRGLRPCKYPDPGEHVCERPAPHGKSSGEVFAPILARLAVLNGAHAFTVGIVHTAPPAFMPLRPCACRVVDVEGLAETIDRDIAAVPLPADLLLRFPDLREASLRIDSLAVCLATATGPPIANPGLVICHAPGSLTLRFAASQIGAHEAEVLAAVLCGERPPAPRTAMHEAPAVHHRVSRWASTTPDAIAIEDSGDTVSYGQLEDRTVKLASRLRAHGADHEALYAILLPQGGRFVTAMLAVLKSGAAYLPLDVSTPVHRLRDIVRDARPLGVITDESHQGTAAHLGVTVIVEDAGEACRPGEDPVVTERDDLAYVIYTSGSTGEPKGSMVEHGAIAHFIDIDIARHAIGPGDRVLHLCSVAFDASVEEILSALGAGATLVIRPATLLDSARSFLESCAEARLTIIGIYASMLGDVLTAMERRGGFPATVRLVTTGGEAVHASDAARWRAFFATRDARPPVFLNVYGLTETTIANCTSDLSEPPDLPGRVPIGRPLPGNLCRVVDEHLVDVAPGAVGELLIAGPQLARAYWNRPSINAARFVHGTAEGSRWFRTGDLVRTGPAGDLYFEGRVDRQVKVSGVRIELEDIERAMTAHPDVTQAAAMLHRMADGREILTAFFSSARPGLGEGMRRHLEQHLPAAMLPRRLEQVGRLPVNERGKIDHRALAAALDHGPVDAGSPAGGTADAAARVWRECFPWTDGESPQESFFDLGGDSLMAVHLLLRAEQETGVHVPASSFFREPNLPGLRRLLRAERSDPAFDPLLAFQPSGSGAPMYMLHGIDGDVAVYYPVVRGVGRDRPILGVRSAALLRQEELGSSVAHVAEEAAAAIRTHRPHGPWILVGYSWAGYLAYETAVQLYVQTGIVPVVIMLDSVAPLSRFSVWDRAWHVLKTAPGWALRAGWSGSIRGVSKLVRRSAVGTRSTDDTAAAWVVEHFLRLSDVYVPTREPRLAIHLIRTTPGRMTPLYRHIQGGWNDWGWQRATGCSVRVHTIRSCNHLQLLKEPVCHEVAAMVKAIGLAADSLGAAGHRDRGGARCTPEGIAVAMRPHRVAVPASVARE